MFTRRCMNNSLLSRENCAPFFQSPLPNKHEVQVNYVCLTRLTSRIMSFFDFRKAARRNAVDKAAFSEGR